MSTALPNHVVEMMDAEALVPLDDVIDEIGRDRFSRRRSPKGRKTGSATQFRFTLTHR